MIGDALFERHRERFERAREACRSREAWSPFADQPTGYANFPSANAAGLAAFEARLQHRYEIGLSSVQDWVGEEKSPYTQRTLGIDYPRCDLDQTFAAAAAGIVDWSAATPQRRAGILLEVIERIYKRKLFELAHAVMHTTGQSFNMAYAGSGVNALDRGIEALVYAYEAMSVVVPYARWTRAFGSAQIELDKRYRLVPRGVAVCFTCASFPTWNAYPSMIASLATGNAVIVKPHPATVLPMAISVEIFREELAEQGFNADLVSMVVDTTADPIGKRIIKHRQCAIVDFTGSVRFGEWVERNAPPSLCYTETAGCNVVVLESCEDLDAVVRSLATTLSLFSAQMYTSPQNIYLPRDGIRVGSGAAAIHVSADEVARRLAVALAAIGSDPKKAAAILAAIQSPVTLELIAALQSEPSNEVLLASRPYVHPEYPSARTATPLLLRASPQQRKLYTAELFGPISFVICCDDAHDALRQAARDVTEAGGLTAYVYSSDEQFLHDAECAFAGAGSQLTINLTGPMPLNFAAAYSDYHVTGLNPAGNATLTDMAFVASRFRITQVRRPVARKAPSNQ